MNNNDILIRLRYALDIKNAEMVKIFELGNVNVTIEEVVNLLKKDTDAGQLPCSNEWLDAFLNGFITYKRGPQQGQADKPTVAIKNEENVNNILLKKVKIALSLTSDDMHDILEEAEVYISKGELSAVLRKEGHANYKVCGDRYARNFLKGLALKYRA